MLACLAETHPPSFVTWLCVLHGVLPLGFLLLEQSWSHSENSQTLLQPRGGSGQVDRAG